MGQLSSFDFLPLFATFCHQGFLPAGLNRLKPVVKTTFFCHHLPTLLMLFPFTILSSGHDRVNIKSLLTRMGKGEKSQKITKRTVQTRKCKKKEYKLLDQNKKEIKDTGTQQTTTTPPPLWSDTLSTAENETFGR